MAAAAVAATITTVSGTNHLKIIADHLLEYVKQICFKQQRI
jgi:hypothetical protein